MPLIFWNYLLTLHHNKKCNLILCSVIVFLLINCLILKVFRFTTDFLHKKSTPSSPYCNISLNISLFIELKQFISPFSLFFLIFVFWGCFFLLFFLREEWIFFLNQQTSKLTLRMFHWKLLFTYLSHQNCANFLGFCARFCHSIVKCSFGNGPKLFQTTHLPPLLYSSDSILWQS